MRRFFLLAALPVLLLSSAVRAQTPLKKTLPNGLTVLVLENHAAPVVAVRAYVKTGSIYEGQHLGTGISHLFEHTLFEGTKTRDKKAFNDELQAIGGQSNAYTSHDVTAYHLTTASSYFPRALDLVADMLQNATLPEAEVKVQQGVIHNEMNLGDDDPERTLAETFGVTAFRVHPVRHPIIGYRASFDRLTRQDILDYYKTHYTPENTVLSVAGDVSAQRVFDAATAAFKNWERRVPQTPALTSEPTQTSPRRAVIEKDVSLAYLQMGWHTVPIQSADLYALDALAQVLGGGESSRLVRELRERGNLVSSIASYSSTPNFDAGVFAIVATLPPANLAKVERDILGQVGRIWREGVTDAELKRAQKGIEAAFVFANQSVEAQAEQMAYDELGTGDPSYSRRYVSRIKAVTPEEVRAVALKYLTREGITTAIVKPRAKAAPTATRRANAVAQKPAQLFTLSNGMRLIVRENRATPTVSIVATGAGGARLESQERAGVANLAAEMLTRGTKARTGEQIAGLVDDLGGEMAGFSGYNTWGLRGQFLSGDFRRGLALMRDSLLEPTFPVAELERVKAQVAAEVRSQADDPIRAASLLLRGTFYGAHPYGRSPLGTLGTLPKIARADVKRFWDSVAFPKSTVIAVYGDVNAQAVRRAVEYEFKNWKRSGAPPKAPSKAATLAAFTEKNATRPGLTQVALFYGFPGVDIKNRDRYAVDVLDAALSGASLPGGRLFARLRDNQLVYDTNAFDSPGIDNGLFTVYAATTRENAPKVREIIEYELRRVREIEIEPEELARAKTMSIAARAIDLQGNEAQATEAATHEALGLGFREGERFEAQIGAVTLSDVRRAAEKYLRSENSALAIVGPA